MTNCAAVSFGQYTFGFYNCVNLTNCSGKASSDDTMAVVSGFYKCANLSNCAAAGINITDSAVGGFNACANLVNCIGAADYNGTGGYSAEFDGCTRLMNCVGQGTVSVDAGNGYGFSNCKGMLACYAKTSTTAGIRKNCYPDSQGSGPAITKYAMETGWNYADVYG